MPRLWVLAAALALVAGGSHAAPPPPPSTAPVHDIAWVQLTDRGAEARVITAKPACPDIEVDGDRAAMHRRAAPAANFPLTVCQAPLPKHVHEVMVAGQALPVPNATVKRIVIFGDTGCRLKGKHEVQDCDNPDLWPYAKVARLAAGHHPDLVIHVGDYYYREKRCPDGHPGCAGSPWGDTWASWDADFFAPSAPLLGAAPWVLVRGNHEDCERGGFGWFMLLDGGSAPLACPSDAAPMAIDVGGLTLYILDGSEADDIKTPPDEVAAFRKQLDALKAHPPLGQAWIITHRPIWGLTPVAKAGPIATLEAPLNATEQAAVRGRDLGHVDMVVSGHIHHFASFAFEGRRPPQLIVGTGGDIGPPADSPKFVSDTVDIDGMSARRFGFERYGFLVLDRTRDGWSGAFYDVRDKPIALCRLTGHALACRPAPAAKPHK